MRRRRRRMMVVVVVGGGSSLSRVALTCVVMRLLKKLR